MSEEKNQKIIERGVYVNNYFRGMIRTSKVSLQYSDGIWEMKRLLAVVMDNADGGRVSSDTEKEKKSLTIVAVAIILWLLLYLVIPLGDSAGKIRAIYTIALLIAIYVQTKEFGWIAGAAVLYFVAAFLSAGSILTLAIIAVFAVITLKSLASKKKEESLYNKSFDKLIKLQTSLTNLLPELRRELTEWQQNWYQENADVLTEEDLLDFMGEGFPPAFWWQVNVADVWKLHSVINCDRYADWETRIIEREPGKEFEATDEYSPLFAPLEADNAEIMSYFRDEAQCMVFDAISRTVVTRSRANTVSYQVPAHSEMQRFAAHMSVYSLAHDIDKSYSEGKLSSSDYRQLSNEMFGLGMLAADYANETKTEHLTEYIPIHHHTDTWTGQFMIKEIPAVNGGTCLAVMQYYCQFPHLLENLKTLDGYAIGYIDYDFWNCNPYFLARFYSRHPESQ
ncbi:MAG: hypothetical protein IJZ85_12525 [Lachnospiraceae bacterium]|nr:hypothetical protein [Lachnospiraceae bacterium]